MKAAISLGLGGSTRFELRDFARPKPHAHEVLVEVYASSVNPKDWKYITVLNGLMARVGLPPFVLGDDMAGVVVEKGAKVVGFEAGDAVYGMSIYPNTGAIAQYARLDTRRAALKPSNLSFSEAAGTPLAGLTALQALRAAEIHAGSKVLILGASGAVGTFATQIAKAFGAEVAGLCSTKNLELVRTLGADEVIDYTQPNFTVPERKFDAVFDAVSHYPMSACASWLKPDGIYVSALDGVGGTMNLLRDKVAYGHRRAKFVFVKPNSQDLNTLRTLCEEGKLRPVIDSEYAFDDVGDAFARSRSGRSRGKVIVNVKPR